MITRSPIEHLKRMADTAQADKNYLEAQINAANASCDLLTSQFKEVGLSLIDIKAAIKTLEAASAVSADTPVEEVKPEV